MQGVLERSVRLNIQVTLRLWNTLPIISREPCALILARSVEYHVVTCFLFALVVVFELSNCFVSVQNPGLGLALRL